jgi:hypothetical protein
MCQQDDFSIREFKRVVMTVRLTPKPRSLVQKRLLANSVGATTVNCIQHGDRISKPCACPASDQSLDVGGRDALASFLRPIKLSAIVKGPLKSLSRQRVS